MFIMGIMAYINKLAEYYLLTYLLINVKEGTCLG